MQVFEKAASVCDMWKVIFLFNVLSCLHNISCVRYWCRAAVLELNSFHMCEYKVCVWNIPFAHEWCGGYTGVLLK